jgi:hypothetical protein
MAWQPYQDIVGTWIVRSFVRYRKLWHVCSSLDDTFSDFVF